MALLRPLPVANSERVFICALHVIDESFVTAERRAPADVAKSEGLLMTPSHRHVEVPGYFRYFVIAGLIGALLFIHHTERGLRDGQ